MTVYHFEDVLVGVGPTGVLHAAGNQTVTVIDPLTGLTPAGLTQNGVAVSYVTSASHGALVFEANVGIVAASAPLVGFDRTLIAAELYGGTPTGGGGVLEFDTAATWRLWAGQANGTASYATGTLYLAPVVIPKDCHCDGLAVQCTTVGGASSAAYATLFSSSLFAPANRLAVTGSLDITTTGTKGGTFTSIALPAGLYWAGLLVSVGTGQAFEKLAAISGGNDPDPPYPWLVMPYGTGSLPTVNVGNSGGVALQTGLSTVPTTFAGTRQTDSNAPKQPPCVWMRIAA